MTQISVIVSTYNREKLLRETLDSLKNQTLDPSQFELIIVNNNSADNTEQEIQDFMESSPALDTLYIKELNQGLSYARNAGIRMAKYEALVLFDDDLIVEPETLEKILNHFKDKPHLMAAGGKILPRMLTELPEWYSRYFWGLIGHIDYGDRIRSYPGQRYPSGAFLIFHKSVFEKYGMFDTTLGRKGAILLGNEEKEIFARLRKHRETVLYFPDLCVHHAVESNKFDIRYLKRLCNGIGFSERKRMDINKESKIGKLLEYIGKLGYAIAYGISYLIKGQFSKFKMLVLFRWWVLKGFLQKDESSL